MLHPLFYKEITQITEADLVSLIDNEVAEAQTVEYKSDLPGSTRDDRKEFLADVSSFANTSGGVLFFGIEEEGGLPTRLAGLKVADEDAVKLKLENLLRDGVEPRLSGVDLGFIPTTQGPVLLLKVPRSWVAPHRVTLSRHFYRRNSAGKYPLDVAELRRAFDRTGEAVSRLRQFRRERLALILADEMPVQLSPGPKLVLHVLHLALPEVEYSPTIHELARHGNDLELIPGPANGARHNLDGYVSYGLMVNSRDGNSLAYTQLFRNGAIEAVDSMILEPREHSGAQQLFPAKYCEERILTVLPRYFTIQNAMGIEAPLVIALSLLNVQGYQIAFDTFGHRHSKSHSVDRQNLLIPEQLIENRGLSPDRIMHPVFDMLWNSFGYEKCLNYNENGEWVGAIT